MEEDRYIEEFIQLPSKTGKDIIDLEEYAKLPRTNTYESIKAFLEAARKSREVNVCFIVAEWGEGKTSIYEGLLKKPEVIKSDLVIPLSTKRLIVHIKEKENYFTDTGSVGIRFFACLLYAIKDVIENDLIQFSPFSNIKIKPKEEQQPTTQFILNGLRSIFSVLEWGSRVFIFLDEFEDIVDEPSTIRDFIRVGLLEVINGYPKCLSQEPFAGRLHLLIAATPPAYERLRSEVYTDVGRLFGQRALSVQLEKLDRKNAYNYILGVLKYCWKGKLPKIPFSEAGMFNTIYLATSGNTRSIINLIELLLTHAKVHAPDGKIEIINPECFVQALLDRKIGVYGGEVNILNKNSLHMLYVKLEQKCKKMEINFEKCINLVHLLLSSLSPINELEIKEKIGLEKDLNPYLRAIESSFGELWGITEPFVYFKKIIDEEADKFERTKIISALEFYDFDRNNLSLMNILFVPYQKLQDIRYRNRSLFQNYIDFFTSFSSELRSEEEIEISVDKLFDKVRKSEEDYIMLSPAVINIFYPLPSILFLDFIEDLDKRFEIGTKLMRNFTTFDREFCDGIISLLEDGCRNVKISRVFELCGFKNIELINLSYKETTQQYNLRARIFSPLRISEADFNNQIKGIFDEMKDAHIPLLIIFSWNPLPNEIKGVIETYFAPQRGSERVFYYLEFPLTTIQCHQVIGLQLARKSGYKTREERWKARASRIVDEIKFENSLKDFINEGLSAGYTMKQLILEKLKPNEVFDIFRTLLITDGNVNERYKQICDLEKKFRIYGKDFPICPKDIESESAFESYINELKDNGLIKENNGILEISYTPVEKRILAILKEYDRPMRKEDIDKLFVLTTSYGRLITTDIYFNMLRERKEIEFNKEKGFFIRDIRMLDNEFKELKKEIENYRKFYDQFPYGYLASIKQRDINVIIVKDCIADIIKLVDYLDRTYFRPGYEEIKVRKHILLELLVKQLREIKSVIDDFHKKLSEKQENYKSRAISLNSSLKKLEETLSNLKTLCNLIPMNKSLRIKERLQIESKESYIKELENKVYKKEDVVDLSLKLKEQIKHYDGFYQQFRGCLTFDVKMIQLIREIEDLNKIVETSEKTLSDINDLINNLRKLCDLLKEHTILVSQKRGIFSSIIQNWIKHNIKVIMERAYGR